MKFSDFNYETLNEKLYVSGGNVMNIKASAKDLSKNLNKAVVELKKASLWLEKEVEKINKKLSNSKEIDPIILDFITEKSLMVKERTEGEKDYLNGILGYITAKLK